MTTLAGLLQRLEDSALAETIRQSLWLYPALEIVHIVGIVLLVGAAFLFDLRLLGFSPAIPVKALAQHLLPWSRRGLYLILPSGILLFSTNAVALSVDPVFHVKMIALGAGLVNAGIFQLLLYPSSSGWVQKGIPASAKIIAMLSMLVWLLVISCGRLLAY
ncbi:MAG: hypothetical protein LPK14_07405 [Hymenobacteraceae bacterium]|nr:hypothetical protein [Hymenobacteraceae bacterium]